MVVAAVVARARAAVTADLVGRFRWEAAKGFGLTEPMRVAIAVPRNRLREFRGTAFESSAEPPSRVPRAPIVGAGARPCRAHDADCCADAISARHAPSSTRARASPRRPRRPLH